MDIADQSNDKGEMIIYRLCQIVFGFAKVYIYFLTKVLIMFLQRGTAG